MNTTDKITALRDALDIALDLANAEVENLRQSYGDRLPHKHKSAADDVQTIKDAIAALTADASEDAPEAREVDHADMPPYVVSISKQKLWNWFSRSTNALATQLRTRNLFFAATTGLHHSVSAMLGDHGAIIAAQRKRIYGLEMQMGQMQKGYAKKLKKAARPAPVAATPAPDLSNVLSAVLWLYHRLPRGYDRQSHIERVITELAQATGSNAETLLSELGRAAPAAPIAEEFTRERLELEQRKRMADRFGNRPRTPATADFDLPAPNDATEAPIVEEAAHDWAARGYVVGATVEKDAGKPWVSRAVIHHVHPNGALDVWSEGVPYGWSAHFCKPVAP